MHQADGKAVCFLIGIVSVMTRPYPVRCGKSPPVVSNGGSGRLTIRPIIESASIEIVA